MVIGVCDVLEVAVRGEVWLELDREDVLEPVFNFGPAGGSGRDAVLSFISLS